MESLALASAVMEHFAPTSARSAGSRTEQQASMHLPAPTPSTHLRVFITWVSIFPLVTLGMYGIASLGPITASWPTWFRALLLTGVVVPTATYVVVPQLFTLTLRWMTWRHHRASTPDVDLQTVR